MGFVAEATVRPPDPRKLNVLEVMPLMVVAPPPEPQVVVARTPVAPMERQGFPAEPRFVIVRLEVVALPVRVRLAKEGEEPVAIFCGRLKVMMLGALEATVIWFAVPRMENVEVVRLLIVMAPLPVPVIVIVLGEEVETVTVPAPTMEVVEFTRPSMEVMPEPQPEQLPLITRFWRVVVVPVIVTLPGKVAVMPDLPMVMPVDWEAPIWMVPVASIVLFVSPVILVPLNVSAAKATEAPAMTKKIQSVERENASNFLLEGAGCMDDGGSLLRERAGTIAVHYY